MNELKRLYLLSCNQNKIKNNKKKKLNNLFINIIGLYKNRNIIPIRITKIYHPIQCFMPFLNNTMI